MIAQLVPPPSFADVSFDIYLPDAAEPTQVAALEKPKLQLLREDGVSSRGPEAILDDVDALCAHLATMHPSRYLTLIEGVQQVFVTGVDAIDDESVALRLVSLAGGYRKKYLRATSRLPALTAAGMQT